ncbi:hypothetical protein N2152v2_010229 [Parachlorella kessleri]
MTKVLRALSPRRQRAESLSRAPTAPEGSPASGTQRQGSRTLFSRKRARAQELPDLEKTDAEFEKDWGITKAEEERRLDEFRRAVEATAGPLRPSFDKFYLRRFLRARQHDIQRAKEMFLKHLQWRRENGIDTILEDFVFHERDAFLTLWPQGYHKTDKLGRPIYIQHLGQINVKRLEELTSEERMIKFHVQEYERALKYIFPACSKVAGRNISQTLTILDVQGVGLRHLTGDVKRIMGHITRVDQDNYPETLGKTLIINAPSIFKMIWGLVKPMLDVRTQAKIEVCPSNYLPTLLRWADIENIPEYLGGKSRGSLLDDVGPWKDPALTAEIEADIRRRDNPSQAEPDKGSPVGSPRPVELANLAEQSERQPEQQQQPSFADDVAKDALDSEEEGGDEFYDVRSRRHSMMSAGSSSYLSPDEEFFTPKAPDWPVGDGAQLSFSSDRPLITPGSTFKSSRRQQEEAAAVDGGSLSTRAQYSDNYRSPFQRPSPLKVPDGELSSDSTPLGQQAPSNTLAPAAAAAAAAASQPALTASGTSRAAVYKPVATDELIPSPPLQIPILARVRALEEKIPAVERPVRKYLPGGEPLPSKVVGEGTLLSRVAALERAMEALLQAQDVTLTEAKRRAEQQHASRTCCGCCIIIQAGTEPLTSRIPGHVTALAPGSVARGPLAAAGMEDGTLHLLAAWGGSEPTWQAVQPGPQQLQKESSPTPPASSGMFGRLGSVLRSRPAAAQQQTAPAEDDPTPSSQPVVGLRFERGLPADGPLGERQHQQGLLVVRQDCVENWAVTEIGGGRLLHSTFEANELESQIGPGPVSLLCLAAQPAATSPPWGPGSVLGLVSSCPSGIFLVLLAGGTWRVAGCHRIAEVPAAPGALLCAELAGSSGAGAGLALVWEVGGSAVRLDLGTGKGAPLDSVLPGPLLAGTSSGRGDAWLLLDASGTLHRLLLATGKQQQQQHVSSNVRVETDQPPEPATLVAGAAAGSQAADAVFQVLNAACQGQLGAAAMAQQLASLNALRGQGAANPIARFSRHVLDTLPKIFGAGGETVGEQLQGKIAVHNVLLQCLSDGGCLAQLHPAALRAVFEDGLKLSALSSLRELESKLQDQRKGAGAEGLPFPLHEVAVAAGQSCMGHVLGGGDRTPWEVFYACPSVTVSAFFQEVGAVADTLAGAPGAASQQLDTVVQLARAVQAALGGAAQQRAQYQQWFPHSASSAAAGLDDPEWLASAEVRSALQSLTDACIRLYPLLSREAPGRVAESVSLCFDLAERLLNAYAAALAAVAPVARRALKLEYNAVRDAVLDHLLCHAVLKCRQGAGDGESMLLRVGSLAEAHSAYAILFDACEFMRDRERLYELMTHLAGDDLTEPMTVYVFQRLLSEGRRSELLDLPPQFDADLAVWLADDSAPDASSRLQIRWLHDLRVGDYQAAARSISGLVSNQPCNVGSAKRLLALSKVAAWGASPGWPAEVPASLASLVSDADTKTRLLALQGRLGNSSSPALLDARSLIEAALDDRSDPEAVQVALEAYADTNLAFQRQHRGAFEAAWHRLLHATPWQEVARTQATSTEDDFKALMAIQPLFRAAAACYGGTKGVLVDVVPPEEVYAILDHAAVELGDAGAHEAALSAFQAGCSSPTPLLGVDEFMAVE